jgi:hypothetical protein
VIADATFGSITVMEEIQKLGGTSTLSISNLHSSWLWDVLSHNLPPNHWRAAQNSKNWITTIHTIKDKNRKIVTQQILTNPFQPQRSTTSFSSIASETSANETFENSALTVSSSLTNPIPVFTAETLNNMTISELRNICQQYNILQEEAAVCGQHFETCGYGSQPVSGIISTQKVN